MLLESVMGLRSQDSGEVLSAEGNRINGNLHLFFFLVAITKA